MDTGGSDLEETTSGKTPTGDTKGDDLINRPNLRVRLALPQHPVLVLPFDSQLPEPRPSKENCLFRYNSLLVLILHLYFKQFSEDKSEGFYKSQNIYSRDKKERYTYLQRYRILIVVITTGEGETKLSGFSTAEDKQRTPIASQWAEGNLVVVLSLHGSS